MWRTLPGTDGVLAGPGDQAHTNLDTLVHVSSHPASVGDLGRTGSRTHEAREAVRAAVRLVARSDLAIGYAVLLVGVTVVLTALGDRTYDQVVEASSTNLANLRQQPWAVLLASAFVLSSPWGLWLLPLLMLAYAAAQRWVGRLATIAVAAFGHVGATLVVATGLSAGLAHGALERKLIVHAVDVGVSYGLMCLAAFLVGQVPRRWRAAYVVGLLAYIVLPFALDPSFTGVGHAMAFTIGLLLALVVSRAGRAAARTADRG